MVKYKSTISKEQSANYNILKRDFAERLKLIFENKEFTKIDIHYQKNQFKDLDKRYKSIFDTKWSIFDYDERLGNLIAYTGILNKNFKMNNGIYRFE